MQIGDKVWIFDSNSRQYKDDKGNKLDRCWYRGYFKEKYIIGETKQSWIIGFEKSSIENRTNLKVNKKTLIYSTTNTCGLNGKLYISEEQVDQECWLQDNHYKIQEQVRRCRDYNKLKKIEEILLKQEDKMSETVHYRGILTEVEILDDELLENQCKRILNAVELLSYYKSYQEMLINEFYQTYIINDNTLYLVEKENYEPNEDIFYSKGNEDGTISFEIRYYNGGCSFNEAIENALKNIE